MFGKNDKKNPYKQGRWSKTNKLLSKFACKRQKRVGITHFYSRKFGYFKNNGDIAPQNKTTKKIPMNKRKLLAMKRRTLCHELGHALYFLKEIEPVYYVKERNICGIDVKRQSTLHVYLADDGFRGVFHSNGLLFHNETQVPAEINVCYTLAGYAMENAIYYHGLAMLPFDKIFEEAEEGDDFDLICNLIEKGVFNCSAEDLMAPYDAIFFTIQKQNIQTSFSNDARH